MLIIPLWHNLEQWCGLFPRLAWKWLVESIWSVIVSKESRQKTKLYDAITNLFSILACAPATCMHRLTILQSGTGTTGYQISIPTYMHTSAATTEATKMKPTMQHATTITRSQSVCFCSSTKRDSGNVMLVNNLVAESTTCEWSGLRLIGEWHWVFDCIATWPVFYPLHYDSTSFRFCSCYP